MHASPRLTIVALLIASALGFGLACASESQEDPFLLDHGVCGVFLACGTELAPDSVDGLDVFFGSEGGCWLGSADEASKCHNWCEDYLETLNGHQMMLGEPACGTCVSAADCVDYGPGERCEDGLCKTTADEASSASESE